MMLGIAIGYFLVKLFVAIIIFMLPLVLLRKLLIR